MLALSLTTTLTPNLASGADTLTAWSHSFPSAELVDAAAGLLPGWRVPERVNGVTLGPAWDRHATIANAKSRELWPSAFVPQDRGPRDRTMVEGPRFFVMVSPGTVSVRSWDPVRRDRAHERRRLLEQGSAGDRVLEARDPSEGPARITEWSPKSRSRMVEVMGQLDWSPMFAGDGIPAMVTLTYPGDWLAVAPHAAEARRHFKMFVKRFERAWGRKLIGVWKREFQRRGAPHWHVLMVPPHGQVNGQNFKGWLSSTWASIVGAKRCAADAECVAGARCDYHAHLLAGTGIDYAEGVKARDPKSIGVYFSKHGSWSAKDYQNHAPAEWAEQGSIGRFWGVWGLSKALAGTEVHGDTARAAARTLRRWSRAAGNVSRVPAWKFRTVVDPDTGEVRAKWRKGTRLQRVYRMRYGAGFVAASDGPALASQLSRYLGQETGPPRTVKRSGAGPVGVLP